MRENVSYMLPQLQMGQIAATMQRRRGGREADVPVSKLKIDRSLIRDIPRNADDAAITSAIISMAKSLNLKVTAEGVETEAQMSFLRARSCDQIQGYYFSKPLSADKVVEKMRSAEEAFLAKHEI